MKQENINQTLNGLIKNPRSSDREISVLMGISQPTVSRHRSQLEKEETITYQTVPTFSKVGLNVMAFIEVSFDNLNAKEQLCKTPEVLLIAETTKHLILLTVHSDYHAYSAFVKNLKQYKPTFGHINIVDTGTGVVQAFSTMKLAGLLGVA